MNPDFAGMATPALVVEHSLGGIPGYEARETTDENPARLALVQQVTWAYLRHALGIDDSAWQEAQKTLAEGASPLGRIESGWSVSGA